MCLKKIGNVLEVVVICFGVLVRLMMFVLNSGMYLVSVVGVFCLGLMVMKIGWILVVLLFRLFIIVVILDRVVG